MVPECGEVTLNFQMLRVEVVDCSGTAKALLSSCAALPSPPESNHTIGFVRGARSAGFVHGAPRPAFRA